MQAPAESTQATVRAAVPAVLPAARKRTGRAQTFPAFDSEEEDAPSVKDKAPSINGVLHLPYPLVDGTKGKDHVDYPTIDQAKVSACLGPPAVRCCESWPALVRKRLQFSWCWQCWRQHFMQDGDVPYAFSCVICRRSLAQAPVMCMPASWTPYGTGTTSRQLMLARWPPQALTRP